MFSIHLFNPCFVKIKHFTLKTLRNDCNNEIQVNRHWNWKFNPFDSALLERCECSGRLHLRPVLTETIWSKGRRLVAQDRKKKLPLKFILFALFKRIITGLINSSVSCWSVGWFYRCAQQFILYFTPWLVISDTLIKPILSTVTYFPPPFHPLIIISLTISRKPWAEPIQFWKCN